ncbi:MAG: DNA replication/repair protein RecF [Rhizobiales bacterium 65-9]|nr:DNA replication/repair protein RecF [Hyphomicrobiales bacterium]OJY37228.1 MAG: DNA replication/repair protein RecF [Rhizobiales bacterium 65-9]
MSAAPQIERLILQDFRTYPTLDLAVDARLVALAGENGAGKTNILEALSLLAPGRGLRRIELSEAARMGGSGGWTVSVAAEGALGLTRLGTALDPAGVDGAARRFRLDGETVGSVAAFSDHLRLVWLTPDQDSVFRGPAGDRRRFLDRLVLAIDPTHGSRVNALEKALRQRNRLLEDASPDARWLSAVEHEVAALAVAVTASRAETVRRLDGLIADTRDEASAFPWARVALVDQIAPLLSESAAAAEDRFAAILRDQRDADRAAGRALKGPQAADLLVRHGPKDIAADAASTGEQKALLLGLVLAHARLVATMSGLAPVILLDEVAAHLDPRRRAALYEALAALGAQVWMTGADPALFDDFPGVGRRFFVTPGRVEPMR